MRNDKDAESDPAATSESPDPPREQTPFERFEEFARKVVSVPRSEIERREREYQKSRSDPDRRKPA